MTLSRLKFARSLDWNLLKTFYQIVQSRGITAAAIALSRKQSTISYSLKRIEQELGVRLCIRGPAGFKLTDEGQLLFEHCSTIFKRVDGIPTNLDNLSEEIHGQLKIQMISNLVSPTLDTIFSKYINSFPYIELDIEIVPWEAITKALLRNSIDIGIGPISSKHAELQYDLLFKENHRVYCARDHPLFGKSISRFKDLSKHKFVLTGNDEPEKLTKFRLKNHLGHHIGGISSSLEEAKRLTLSGAGICFLPEGFTVGEVKNDLLWPVTEVIDELTLKIFLIAHPTIPVRLAVQYFLDISSKLIDEKTAQQGKQIKGGKVPPNEAN
jgi:DNA-binding transcriptional LysR family regulator